MAKRFSETSNTSKSVFFRFVRGLVIAVAVGFLTWSGGKLVAEKLSNSAGSKSSVTAVTESAVKDGGVTTVCLDPGHGGSDDPGATNSDVIERDINLLVANKVSTLLVAEGYKVVLTRTSNDTVMNNTERANFCNSQNADILVSIHHNDYGSDSEVDYSSSIYYKSEDQQLASVILGEIADMLGLSNNGISSLEDNVLAKSKMPAALIEAFFISSDYENLQLGVSSSVRLDDEASSIVAGIKKYFSQVQS